MRIVTLDVTLTLRAPVLTRSSSPEAPILDAPMARTNRNGKASWLLPYSLVRGRLRESLVTLRGLGLTRDIEDLLGTAQGSTTLDPQRGRLVVSDFLAAMEQTSEPNIIAGIHMDPERRSVRKGGLYFMEAPFPVGKKVPFQGTITFCASSESEADTVAEAVEKGLRWITSFGSNRSVGFGQLVGVAVDRKDDEIAARSVAGGSASAPETLTLELTVKDPLCVATTRVADNLFESDVVIPGGTIKGALATTLAQLAGAGNPHHLRKEDVDEPWGTLVDHMPEIRFSHAFPAACGANGAKRPVVPPLSLIKNRAGSRYWDVALTDGPLLVKADNASSAFEAPAFQIDWKSRSDVDTKFGWPDLERELRVRTAMDSAHRRAADEQLFAHELVLPGDHVWITRIDLAAMTDSTERANVRALLGQLFAWGILHLGKTGARANGKLRDGEPQMAIPGTPHPLDGGQYVITLQTPALLCDPRQLASASGPAQLEEQYRSYWQEISGGSLTLVRFFARQSLAGGYYGRRFRGNGAGYNPFLLTVPGSVFVLQTANGTAGDVAGPVESWIEHGLPLPQWAKNLYGYSWETNPFVPLNGYGEVAVNLACHTDYRPKAGEYQDV